jgi:hypothetical protein
MDTEESRKRSHRTDEDHWSDKRFRHGASDDTTITPHSPMPSSAALPADDDHADNADADADADPIESVSTVEDMIAVPLDFLFRVVPQTTSAFSMSMSTSTTAASQRQPQRHKPLLSRAEAQCLLTVALLAHEIDSLVALSAKALEQRRSYGSFARKLERTNSPFLRPMLFLLDVVGNHVPTNTLEMIQSELESVTQELKSTAATLRQFSEQNWTLSESLMDSISGTSGEIVAKEKRRLSDVQEEVCTRVERLLQASTGQSDDDLEDLGCSMKDYCARILAPDAHDESLSLAQEASCSQQSEASERKREPASEEKENAPSQSSQQRQQIVVLEEVYGSPHASSENTPSCRISATQNAAEVLSSLGKVVGPGGSSETP